ncbi:hypothetical protein AOLI_G00070040 [Acnodon oligacanthus]
MDGRTARCLDKLARQVYEQEISESSRRRTVQRSSGPSEETLGLRRRSIFIFMAPSFGRDYGEAIVARRRERSCRVA